MGAARRAKERETMANSVQTNMGSMVALQNLNSTSRALEKTQGRINTGLKVATAKDNGAAYNIAQQMRSEHSAYEAVRNGLNRAKSMADVGLAAGEAISDVLTQMRDKAVAASDASISATSRTAYNNEFISLRDQITSIVANAVFDGANLINGSPARTFLANTNGSQTVTIPSYDLSLVGVGLTATTNILLVADAATSRGLVETALTNVNTRLAGLGVATKRIESHEIFVGKLQDAITGGIGTLVDADMASESARLQSLQVKQQLGTQALSIANQAPQSILSLFRN
jgi:flagellin